ncbi:MAG: arylsulfatase, partial [bacterium]|nr:arylsulfatase [bacterium]
MRFDWLSLLQFLTCLLALHAACAAEDRMPNVILIYTDDQGFGDVSCLNPEAKFETPNMDRLAAEGISFTDAHCSDTVCTPSRYGLLTGRYAWRTSLKRGVMQAEGACLIADGRPTLASMLRDQGFATGMVGKWHLGMEFPGSDYTDRDWSRPIVDMPLDKGFDHFFGIPASLNYGVLAWFDGRYASVPPTLFTAKKPNERHLDYRIMPPYEQSPTETRQVLGKIGMEVAPDFVDNQCLTRFTDEAVRWIRERVEHTQDQPFFLYLPMTSPHYPVCPLPQFQGQGMAGAYGEFVIETDFHLGRILQALEELKIDDDTLIIFTSDNGPENSWRSRQQQFGHASNGIYREGKRSIYEGGHRVPFFVRWPAGIRQPGREYSGLVCQTDLLATLAEMVDADLPPEAGEDSQSFLKILKDPSLQIERAPLINHAANGRFAIRNDRWKLIMPHAR